MTITIKLTNEQKREIYIEVKRSYIAEDICCLLDDRDIDPNIISKEDVEKMVDRFIYCYDWSLSEYDQLADIVDDYIKFTYFLNKERKK